MAGFCLPKELTTKFRAALKNGTLNPSTLHAVTSAERRAAFTDVVGEGNAHQVNALFESKLLLKNQTRGLIDWARSVGGLKPEVMKDFVTKVNGLDRVLDPVDQQHFLEDFAQKKLGTKVSIEEAQRSLALAKAVEDARGKIKPDSPKGSPERLAYGRSKVAFDKYFADLKNEAKGFKVSDLKTNPGRTALKAVTDTAGLAKSLKATLDFSVILRQGLKTALTHPTIWAKNSLKSFVDAARTLGGKEVMDEVLADVHSRPNALNGLYKKEKLAIGTQEEAYPTSLPEKIPVVGRVFKASEVAYEAWQYRTRADTFDLLHNLAEKSGADSTGLGKLVNAATGRGDLGVFEPAAGVVNNLFFSPRFLKSNIDLLTVHAFDKNISPFVRKQAALNLAKVVGTLGITYGVFNALKPGSVEPNPESSDFGKIKIGNTRFDISAGNSSLITLATRLAKQESKSSITHKTTKLDTGKYGAPTTGSVLMDFAQNKLSPLVAALGDLRKGVDRNNNPVNLTTPKGALNLGQDVFAPLPITTYQELASDPNSAGVLAGLIFDELGVSTNTYGGKKK